MAVQDSKRRVALITGVTGQDGAYLAEYLLGLGYIVHGSSGDHPRSTPRASIASMKIPTPATCRFLLHYGDMTDSTNPMRLMQQIRQTETYKLATQSLVGVSFKKFRTANTDAIDVLRLPRSRANSGHGKETRF